MNLSQPFPIGERADGSPITLNCRADDPGIRISGKSDLTDQILTAAWRCPTCDSPQPSMHPAVGGGGEVTAICPDAWHEGRPTTALTADMRSGRPAGDLITDPQQLGGFELVDGLLLSLLGDDGDYTLVIGHHDEDATRNTVATFLGKLEYDDPRGRAYTGSYDTVYARFTLDPDTTSDNWWCDWSGPDATAPHPDRIAITLIGIE